MTLAERIAEAQRRKEEPPKPQPEWLRRGRDGLNKPRLDYGKAA